MLAATVACSHPGGRAADQISQSRYQVIIHCIENKSRHSMWEFLLCQAGTPAKLPVIIPGRNGTRAAIVLPRRSTKAHFGS